MNAHAAHRRLNLIHQGIISAKVLSCGLEFCVPGAGAPHDYRNRWAHRSRQTTCSKRSPGAAWILAEEQPWHHLDLHFITRPGDGITE
jgi:hypothetical protein